MGRGLQAMSAAKGSPNDSGLGAVPEILRHEFEELGLSPYEARVVVALLQLGSANTLQLARVSEVPRTSIYQVLEELSAKRLAERLGVEGPAVWSSPGRDVVLDRLHERQEERLRDHRERTERLRALVAETFPDEPSLATPYVHLVPTVAQARKSYRQLLTDAVVEVLVCNRPPYTAGADEVNSIVMETLDRGIAIRVLYEARQWRAAEAQVFREAMAVYHAAGVQGRLVDELPMKLTIADRRVVLLAMTDPAAPQPGFPTSLLVEHAGFAQLLAAAFDLQWASATPCQAVPARRGRTSVGERL